MPKIPEPEYIADSVDGAIYQTVTGARLLIDMEIDTAVTAARLIARGSFTICYGISLLRPPTEAVIPGLFFGERGGSLVGREGWQYLQDHFQVHPRADVVGLKIDGTRAEYWVRELDFGVPVRVFAYAAPTDTKPLIELHAFSAADVSALPELFVRYLPRV